MYEEDWGMAESDDKLNKVDTKQERKGDVFDRLLRAVQTVGFPIVVAGFLLFEWHYTVNDLKALLVEVKLLMQDVRHDLRGGTR